MSRNQSFEVRSDSQVPTFAAFRPSSCSRCHENLYTRKAWTGTHSVSLRFVR